MGGTTKPLMKNWKLCDRRFSIGWRSLAMNIKIIKVWKDVKFYNG